MLHSVPCLTAVAAALGLASPCAALPRFDGLGDLAGGSYVSRAWAVSADGTTVVGASTSDEGGEAFRWRQETGLVGLGQLPRAGYSNAKGTSSDGSVVSGYSESPFRWTEADGMVDLGSAQVGSNRVTYGHGVSADGSIVVGRTDPGDPETQLFEAFRWTEAGGFELLGDLLGGNHASEAFDISADGSVVVGESYSEASQASSAPEAFVWTETSGMSGLGDLPGGRFRSTARGVSADGTTVVGSSSSAFDLEAFRWTEEAGMVGLGVLHAGDSFSTAYAATADGTRVVGSSMGVVPKAFIWDEESGMRDLQQLIERQLGLDLGGWQLQAATGISDDGRVIVGYGSNPHGFTEAWRVVIPEPSTAALLCAGLVWMTIRRGKQ